MTKNISYLIFRGDFFSLYLTHVIRTFDYTSNSLHDSGQLNPLCLLFGSETFVTSIVE